MTFTPNGFFVDFDNDAVGRYHCLSVFGAYPIFQDVLQLVRIIAELGTDIVQCFRILAVQHLFFGGFVGFVDLLLEFNSLSRKEKLISQSHFRKLCGSISRSLPYSFLISPENSSITISLFAEKRYNSLTSSMTEI